MRLAFMKALRPKAVRELEDFVRGLVRERLDLLIPRGTFDLLADYGGYVSAAVTCRLFDIPLSETEAVRDAVNSLADYDEETGKVDIPAAFRRLADFIQPAIERRRAAGADGSVPMIDGLINYRAEDGRALATSEISDQLVCSFIANTETPPRPAAQGLLALADHPVQLAEVRQDLATNVPIAVEEMLRVCTTAQWMIRTAHRDVEVAGVAVKAGQRVLVSPFAASRDEREFVDAEAFVWNRPIPRTLSFGFGQHHCVGNHIARLQIRLLVGEFLARVGDYGFDLAQAKHSESYFHWGYNKLPVTIRDRRP
jgi:cytochrome P450